MNKKLSKTRLSFQQKSAMAALRILKKSIGIIPRWIVQPIMEVMFSIVCFCSRRLKEICLRNLEHVFKSKTQDEYKLMYKQSLKNIGHTMIDMLYYMERPDEFKEISKLENENVLSEALKKGKGAIIVTAHLGNFPLMFMSLVQRGYKVNVIIRQMRNNSFSDFMFEQCDVWGINMIEKEPRKELLRECLRVLRNNELLFILLDEAVSDETGIEIDFLGAKVNRAVGPLLFHERTGAPILPMFITKEEDKTFKIHIEKEVSLEEGPSTEESTFKNISHLSTIIESFIKQYPIQWGGWFNKKWRLNQ